MFSRLKSRSLHRPRPTSRCIGPVGPRVFCARLLLRAILAQKTLRSRAVEHGVMRYALRASEMSALKIIAAFLLSISVAACVGSKAGAYRVFAEDLQRLKGAPFNTSYVYLVGYLAQGTPIQTKRLDNGNEIRMYKIIEPRKQDCTVLIEVDPKTERIVDASSKGPECWRPY